VPLLPLGPCSPVQTILLSDLVGCDSPLQIVMAVWRNLFQAGQTDITICSGLSRPTQQVHILKSAPNGHYYLVSTEGCRTRLDGQHCSLRTYHGV
jgi:hypothetical protein